MRRIKGIVRTVVAIAGAISLNSPMVGLVAAGSGPRFTSELNGFEDVSCKIQDWKPAKRGGSSSHPERADRQIRKGTGVDSRRG